MNHRSSIFVGLLTVGSLVLTSPAPAATASSPTLAGTWRSHTCGVCLHSVALAPDGAVWVGAAGGGVGRFDRATETFQRWTTADGLGGNWVDTLAVDGRGTVWVAGRSSRDTYLTSQGLSRFDGRRWTTFTTADGLPAMDIVQLAGDAVAGAWLALGDAGAAYTDGTTWHHFTMAEGLGQDAAQRVAVGPDGVVWFAGNAGISRHRHGVWGLVHYDLGNTEPVSALSVDAAGKVWVAFTDADVARFDGRIWEHFGRLFDGGVLSLASGPDGTVWALQSGGDRRVARFDGGGWRLIADRTTQPAPNWRFALVVAPDTQLFAAGLDGLERYDGRAWHRYRDDSGPLGLVTAGLAVDHDDDVWLIGFAPQPPHQLHHYDGRVWRAYRDDRPPAIDPSHTGPIGVDGHGAVWWSDAHEVVRFDGESWQHFTPTVSTPEGLVNVIADDRRGGVWVGTRGAGASHWDGSRWTRVTTDHGLPSNDIRSILVDTTGATWFGGASSGVTRWRNGRWTYFRESDGLLGDDVLELAVGDAGTVWVAGKAGISHFEGQRWTTHAAPVPADPGWKVLVATDKIGGVWYTNNTSGIHRLAAGQWTHVRAGNALVSDYVTDFDIDSRGHVWVATLTGISEFIPDIPPSAAPCICAAARRLLPGAVLDDAAANPERYDGWRQPGDPGKPVGPLNPLRTCLSLRYPSGPYQPQINDPLWRVGCP